MFEIQKVIAAAEKVDAEVSYRQREMHESPTTAESELHAALRSFYEADRLPHATSFRVPHPDRRRLRTNVLVAEVLQAIGPFLREDERVRGHEEASRILMHKFYEAGVDFLTDQDRAELGLSERGANGWTAEEVQALEAKRLEALMAPLPPLVTAR